MIGDETKGAFLAAVGLRVRLARTGRRLSQNGLADRAGVSRVTLGRVELGKHDAGLATYRSLAMALDVPLSALVEGDDGLARLVAVSTRPAREAEQSEGLPS